MVQMKNKIGILMEAGVSYNKQKLHKAGYFRELLATNPISMKDCVRYDCAARRWCACRKQRRKLNSCDPVFVCDSVLQHSRWKSWPNEKPISSAAS
jgi:hypothetical protein